MGGIVTGLVTLFTGGSAKLMWSLVGILILVSTISVGVLLYMNTKKENELLKNQNGQLTQTVQQRDQTIQTMAQDQQDYVNRANKIADQVNALQGRMEKNSAQRRQDISNIVTPPSAKATPNEVAAKATAGMNNLFHDTEALSREGLNATSPAH